MTKDSAKGPAAGYLFQFEIALLLISRLQTESEFITVEDVDDIAQHNEHGTVLLTIQAKHSIASSGSTFEDTSYALWRTLQLWIKKLEMGTYNHRTAFKCSTNKEIKPTSLLYKIKERSYEEVLIEIQNVLIDQKKKLKEAKKGTSITKTIKLIEYVLEMKEFLKVIKNNLEIESALPIKNLFYEEIHLSGSNYTDVQRESIFQEFYGWIISSCISKWRNGLEAKLSKKNFNDKYYHVNKNSSIVNIIFRTKQSIGSISAKDILDKRKDLFVRQIENINRNKDAKERIIKEAILDFIYSDIELTYIIEKGDYVQTDFEEFLDLCFDTWQNCFDEHVTKEIQDYNNTEKNDLAIRIFDKIMNHIDIKFKNNFSFHSNNKYIRNGSFLKLSNMPKIGWKPDWKNIYLNE